MHILPLLSTEIGLASLAGIAFASFFALSTPAFDFPLLFDIIWALTDVNKRRISFLAIILNILCF